MPETAIPFTTFRFSVQVRVPGISNEICQASFSECTGLEMTMQPKTIREGGNNTSQIHLVGPLSYGRLQLKRGMTRSAHLWGWFERVMEPGRHGLRADAVVNLLAADSGQVDASFFLGRCLPVKLKAPSLNAKDGVVAIEEMQLAYETLRLRRG